MKIELTDEEARELEYLLSDYQVFLDMELSEDFDVKASDRLRKRSSDQADRESKERAARFIEIIRAKRWEGVDVLKSRRASKLTRAF